VERPDLEYYRQHYLQANQWLIDNAPDWVVKTVNQVSCVVELQGERINDLCDGFESYCQHRNGCDRGKTILGRCSCGLEDILDVSN